MKLVVRLEDRSSALVSIPAAAFHSHDFTANTLQYTATGQGGEVFLALPAVAHPGESSFELSSVSLRPGQDTTLVSGLWSFILHGPPPAQFPDLMRVEQLRSQEIGIGGTQVIVTGARSSGRTLIDYALPPGMRELAPPTLATNTNERLAAITVIDLPTTRRAVFPSTEFGTPSN